MGAILGRGVAKKTEEEQLELLKWEYTGLYLLVCKAKGISI